MKTTNAVILAGILAGLAVTTDAQAQTWRFDLGPNAGYSYWTSAISGDETGGSSAGFNTGWLVGGHATLWAWPRVGIRANGAYSQRAFEGDALRAVGAAGTLDQTNIFALTGDLMFRLREPATSYVGGEWLPYVALGAGLRWIRPQPGVTYTAVDGVNNETWPGVPFTVTDGNGQHFFLGRLSNPVFLAALGTDVRIARPFALRLEVGDRMSKPRIYQIQPGPGPVYPAINGRTNRAALAHDIYGQVGLQLTLGGAGPVAPVVMAPPPPPVTTTPTPPAQPREEQLSICVIDPAAAGGMRTVNAFRVDGRGDTLVVRGSERVPLRTTLGTVPLVGAAEWYIAGRPLEFAVDRQQLRFLAVGSAAPRQPAQLQLIGTLQGMPVYAERAALGAAADRFAQLNATPVALTTSVQQADVRGAVLNLSTLYVPAQTIGCVFQPLQLQQEVRKSGL